QSGGGPVTLRVKYKVGEVSQYQSNMAVTMGGAKGASGSQATPGGGGGMPLQQMSAIQQFKTSKLLSNGSAQVVITTINMQGGAAMGSTSLPKPVTLVMDSRGAVTSAVGASGSPSLLGGLIGSDALGTQQFPLPPNAVKPGSTWTMALPMPGMGTGNVKGQFVKFEAVGAYKTALLHYLLTMPVKVMMDASGQPTKSAAASTMTISGTIVMNIDNDVDIASGRLIRSSGTGTMAAQFASKNIPKQIPPKEGAPPKPAIPKAATMAINLTLGTTLVSVTPPGKATAAPTTSPKTLKTSVQAPTRVK
ncbi:MAG: hypothetical protein JWN14_2069, partial [Chthonomonadales bacterium]|nr:hypothetical protein [Chthonomonadales bacterium]